MALEPAPLELGYGNKCGVQLRHGSFWGAALPTAPLKQIKDLLCLEHCPCPAAERDRQHWGWQWCWCRAQGRKEGLSQPWLRTDAAPAPELWGCVCPTVTAAALSACGTAGDTQLCVWSSLGIPGSQAWQRGVEAQTKGTVDQLRGQSSCLHPVLGKNKDILLVYEEKHLFLFLLGLNCLA